MGYLFAADSIDQTALIRLLALETAEMELLNA